MTPVGTTFNQKREKTKRSFHVLEKDHLLFGRNFIQCKENVTFYFVHKAH